MHRYGQARETFRILDVSDYQPQKSKQSFFGFFENCFIYKYVRKFGLWVTPRISKNKGIFLIFVDLVMGRNKSQDKGTISAAVFLVILKSAIVL